METYECYGKFNWYEHDERHIFDYRFPSSPQAGDIIELTRSETEAVEYSDKWIVVGRRWREGKLQLLIEIPNDGLVLA